MTTETVNRHFPLLGGDVEIRVRAETLEAADAADRAAVGELKRLETLFTLFDQTSALSRWRHGHLSDLPPELVAALRIAQEWFEASGGAFHPATEGLRRRWLRADDSGELPTAAELQELVGALRTLPYHVDDDGVVHRQGDTETVDLNAVARGFIVDRAAEASLRAETVASVLVTAGSTLRHCGSSTTKVAIPGHDGTQIESVTGRDFCVVVSNRGLSKSDPRPSGFIVGGDSYPKVLDPRTGWPVRGIASVTVIAPDALTAHVAATVVEVLHPEAAAEVLAGRPGLDYLAVMSDGREHRSANWPGQRRG